MDFEFSPDQKLVRSGVERFLDKEYAFERRRQSVDAADGVNAAIWAGLAELGVFALGVPEALGGLGCGLLELGLVMEALGRHLVIEPVLPTVTSVSALLAGCGSEAQAARWLTPVMAGEARIALAHREVGQAIAARVAPADGGWRVDGAKRSVIGAVGARHILVSACDPAGDLRLLCVDAGSPGLAIAPIRMLDGSMAADVGLDDVFVPADAMLALEGLSEAIAQAARDEMIAACWEIVGAMAAALEQTSAYVQQRVQFGQPLATFQAVQHGLARMAVCCEEARAAVLLATLKVGSGDARHVAMAEAKTAQCADLVARNAVQFHGGMGVCDELPIASYFRKVAFFRSHHADQWEAVERYGEAVIGAALHQQSAILPVAPALF